MERFYIKFVDLGFATKEQATRVWAVLSDKTMVGLGEVKWFGPWRRYAFYPAEDVVLDGGCLTEVADFLALKTAERKESWTNKTKRARGE